MQQPLDQGSPSRRGIGYRDLAKLANAVEHELAPEAAPTTNGEVTAALVTV